MNMKRLHALLLFAFIALATPAMSQDWDIYSSTSIGNSAIPAGNYWWIHAPAVLTLTANSTLNIYGTLYIDPGAALTVLYNATVIVHNGGRIELLDGSLVQNPTLSFFERTNLQLASGSSLDIGAHGLVQFADSNATVSLQSGSYIDMTKSSRFMNTAQDTLFFDCYESHPFRGTGTLRRLYATYHNGLTISRTDTIVIEGSSTYVFPCPASQFITIFGSLELAAIIDRDMHEVQGCPGAIFVKDSATFKITECGFAPLPDVIGSIWSKMIFIGDTTSGAHLAFNAGKGLMTTGSLYARKTGFLGCPMPSWSGIQILGPYALVDLDSCVILEVRAGSALLLDNATNAGNTIKYCDFHTPITPMGTTAAGVRLTSISPAMGSRLSMSCSHVMGFVTGLFSTYGATVLDGVVLDQNVDAVRLDTASATITNSCMVVSGNHGIIINGPPPRDSIYIFESNIVQNDGVQVELNYGARATISRTNVYHDTGNTTLPVIAVSGGSIAIAQNNWWGVFPTDPAMFREYSGVIIHVAEDSISYPLDCMCDDNPKRGYGLRETVPSELTVTNYPNPFNPSTIIEFSLPENAFVTLRVYSITGEEVATLVNGPACAGTHTVPFTIPPGKPSGLYMYRLSTPMHSIYGRMMLMK